MPLRSWTSLQAQLSPVLTALHLHSAASFTAAATSSRTRLSSTRAIASVRSVPDMLLPSCTLPAALSRAHPTTSSRCAIVSSTPIRALPAPSNARPFGPLFRTADTLSSAPPTRRALATGATPSTSGSISLHPPPHPNPPSSSSPSSPSSPSAVAPPLNGTAFWFGGTYGSKGSLPPQPPVAARPTQGHLHLIIGPMFAGKTTRLLRHIAEHRAEGRAVLVVKSATDTRSKDSHVQTHDGEVVECCAVRLLSDVRRDGRYIAAEVVAVDEAQFFPDLLDGVVAMADQDKKVVYVAGLDGDFRRRPFGQILDLVPHAELVTKLSARCHLCGGAVHMRASFTQRTVDSSEQVLVGGAEAYRPVCRHHFVHGPDPVGVGAAPGAPVLVEVQESGR